MLQVVYNLGVITKASHFQKFPESNPNLLEFFQPFSHIHFPIVIFWDHTEKSFQVQVTLVLALDDFIKDATDVDISTSSINLIDNTSDVDIVEVKVVKVNVCIVQDTSDVKSPIGSSCLVKKASNV